MRIGLNLLHALPTIGGGWNYIGNLIAALGEWDSTNTYVAFVTCESACLVPDRPNFEKVLVNVHSEFRPLRILYENTLLQYLVLRNKVDCLHWFAGVRGLVNTVPAVVTIYDLQPFSDYLSLPWVKHLYLQMMLKATINRGSLLLPISQATANDLRSKLGADPARMVVIPVILESQFKPALPETIVRFRKAHHLPDHYWLYVAHTYPHKNHVRLLYAYHTLKTNGFHPWTLVLRGNHTGGEAEIYRTVKQLNLEQEVIFLPELERSELPALYSAASALVFPSLYEGCGIPVTEAMACGCPVVASDIPPIRESADDAAIYFDPTDTEAIAQEMKQFQLNSDEHEPYCQRGLELAKKYYAAPIIEKLVSAYRQIVERYR